MTDYLPAPFNLDTPPTVEEFAHAVRFGFGRAILWLQRHDPAPYRDVSLEAALTDHRFESSESHRTAYTRELIRLAGHEGKAREALAEAAKVACDHMDGERVVDLASHLAAEGTTCFVESFMSPCVATSVIRCLR